MNSPSPPVSPSPQCLFRTITWLVIIRCIADGGNQREMTITPALEPNVAFISLNFSCWQTGNGGLWARKVNQDSTAQLEYKLAVLLTFIFPHANDLTVIDRDYHQIKNRISWHKKWLQAFFCLFFWNEQWKAQGKWCSRRPTLNCI